jgi:hypothetical protein
MSKNYTCLMDIHFWSSTQTLAGARGVIVDEISRDEYMHHTLG